jgi:hypothetical protein
MANNAAACREEWLNQQVTIVFRTFLLIDFLIPWLNFGSAFVFTVEMKSKISCNSCYVAHVINAPPLLDLLKKLFYLACAKNGKHNPALQTDKKSTLISTVSQGERTRFFKYLRRKIAGRKKNLKA